MLVGDVDITDVARECGVGMEARTGPGAGHGEALRRPWGSLRVSTGPPPLGNRGVVVGAVGYGGRAVGWATFWDRGASANCRELDKWCAVHKGRGRSRADSALGPETVEG